MLRPGARARGAAYFQKSFDVENAYFAESWTRMSVPSAPSLFSRRARAPPVGA